MYGLNVPQMSHSLWHHRWSQNFTKINHCPRVSPDCLFSWVIVIEYQCTQNLKNYEVREQKMPIYCCHVCGYATRKKDHFQNHLNRQIPCSQNSAEKRIFDIVEKRVSFLLQSLEERLKRLELTVKRLVFRLNHFEPDCWASGDGFRRWSETRRGHPTKIAIHKLHSLFTIWFQKVGRICGDVALICMNCKAKIPYNFGDADGTGITQPPAQFSKKFIYKKTCWAAMDKSSGWIAAATSSLLLHSGQKLSQSQKVLVISNWKTKRVFHGFLDHWGKLYVWETGPCGKRLGQG